MYLTVSAVVTLMLLAWHFSIQAAAHDAAIVQVRAWLGNMNASAGHVQFRLLRGALTVEQIKADVQGHALSIESLFIKGNPASITTAKPLLQQVRVQGLSFDAAGIVNTWQNAGFALPTPLQAIFKYAKSITISDGRIAYLPSFEQLHIQTLNIRGAVQEREMLGSGEFFHDDEQGQWHIESFMPQHIGQQTGKFSASSATQNMELLWSGAWATQNMQVTMQRHSNDDSELLASLHQSQQQWEGEIHSQAWPIQTTGFESIITGHMTITGTAKYWRISSEKLLWEETSITSQQLFIQSMTSYNVALDNQQKTISSTRLDIEDANIDASPEQSLLHTSWQLDVPNINIQNLYSSFGDDHSAVNLPALNGTAAIQQQNITFDVSAQVDEHQFWRLRSQNKGAFYLSATHVPLLQLRNLLPNPIQGQSYTVQGLAALKLVINPENNWKTTGAAYISDLLLASKNQSFAAKDFELAIQHADANGVQQARIRADHWSMQFPLTPRQAWSNPSHLAAWTNIPWSLNEAVFTHGKVLIGNENNVWLDQAYLRVLNWQKESQHAEATLLGNFGLTPITANMRLKKQSETMDWQQLSIQFDHANMFVLNDWLNISDLPQVQQGHFSIDLTAKREKKHVQGHIDLKLHHLHMISEQQRANYLKQVLDNPLIEAPIKFMHIRTDFQGEDDWSALAAGALMSAIETEQNTEIEKYPSQQKSSQRLGSLRIQQDIRLSLNERTRLRKMIKSLRKRKHLRVELTPDLGTAELTPELSQQITQTQAVIQTFMTKRGIKRSAIYAILPQTQHHSLRDVGAVHINVVQ